MLISKGKNDVKRFRIDQTLNILACVIMKIFQCGCLMEWQQNNVVGARFRKQNFILRHSYDFFAARVWWLGANELFLSRESANKRETFQIHIAIARSKRFFFFFAKSHFSSFVNFIHIYFLRKNIKDDVTVKAFAFHMSSNIYTENTANMSLKVSL